MRPATPLMRQSPSMNVLPSAGKNRTRVARPASWFSSPVGAAAGIATSALRSRDRSTSMALPTYEATIVRTASSFSSNATGSRLSTTSTPTSSPRTTAGTATRLHAPGTFRIVAVDLYRDIHNGIRSELFALTEEAGRLDATDHGDRGALAAHLASVVGLLVSHAAHEDTAVQPAIERHLPVLAEQIAADHEALEVRIQGLAAVADELAGGASRRDVQELYVDLAAFTSSYLAHQDLEERAVMPALDDAIGVDAVLTIHQAIIGSIPPDEMAQSLAIMLPAMNVDDRAELLGGMKAGAPAEVFQGVWSLAGSVLTARDLAAVGARLGID